MARIASTTSSSLWRVFGPGLAAGIRGRAGAMTAYTLDRGTRYRAQIIVSG